MDNYVSKIPNFSIRFAVEADLTLILEFIKELADYEHLSEYVTANEEILYKSLFEKRQAEALIADYNGEPAGFVVFFHNFSTFLGKAGIYIEDLYFKEKFRGLGLSREIFVFLAGLCQERGCERLEWNCLDWNEPAIKFYTKMGGTPKSEWTMYRIEGKTLTELAWRQ